MSDETGDDVFDADRIKILVELMIEHGLTELDLRQHGQTIRLRRGDNAHIATQPAATAYLAPAPPAAATPSPTNEDVGLVIIKSPMVGTFYSRSNPEAASFVKVGQDISADQTVCIIEAMKVFNEIAAEVSGKVVAIMVDNEEPVDFGKPLMKIRPYS